MTFAEYVRENWITIVNDTILHFDVTLGAIAIAMVIGLGLGMLTDPRLLIWVTRLSLLA